MPLSDCTVWEKRENILMRIVCVSNHTMLMSTEDVVISLVDTLGVCL